MSNPRLSLAVSNIRQAMQLIQDAGDILTAEILAQENPDLPLSTKEDPKLMPEKFQKCKGEFDGFLGLCDCPVAI